MKSDPLQNVRMVYWSYGGPPTAFDLVENRFVSRAVRMSVHILLRAYLRWFHGYRPYNNAQLRRLRGHLIVANHSSHLDAPVLFAAFPFGRINSVRSLCAKDYFFEHPLKRTIAFLLANTIPMDRDRFDRRAVSYCRRNMSQGANIILFPEGTRSTDGAIGEFKAGIGLLALKYDLPVLPAVIKGTYDCCGKGTVIAHPGRIRVLFGEPVRYRHLTSCRRNWLAVAQDLRLRIGRLSASIGQEQTNHEYATDQGVESTGPHAGQAERRYSHRPRARIHLGQDGGLCLQERTVGKAADRKAS